VSAPRGPAGPAARRYLLAGLLRCGTCGRRLESSWSSGRAAYRCRHGHTSAARPDPGRAKNVYVREDQILRHLTALAILVTGHRNTRGQAQRITAPAQAAELIDYLRVTSTTLTYDPGDPTLRADTGEVVTVARHR
jgi:site-specific DNA recombinase